MGEKTWVEGVNFSSCLYDTNDLSVIRGSSLLYERFAEDFAGRPDGQKPLWAGASMAVYDSDGGAETLVATLEEAAREEPYRHLSFAIGTGRSEAEAQARARVAQMQSWSLPDPHLDGAWRHDSLDGMRPAAPDGHDEIKGHLSPSVAARIKEGRDAARSKARLEALGAEGPQLEGIRFAQDFEDLVAKPPWWVPETMARKIAVIHLDGDGFNKARKAATDPEAFSDALREKFRGLMSALVEVSRKDAGDDRGIAPPVLRMVYLVWGGDDITLVVPAWQVFVMLEAVSEAVASWKIDGTRLGFSGAAIVANVKTPIRQMVALAGTAVDMLKESDTRGSVTIDMFKSLAVPDAEANLAQVLQEDRKVRLGANTPATVAVPLEQIAAFRDAAARLKTDGGALALSRSKAVGLANAHGQTGDDSQLRAHLAEYDLQVLGHDVEGAENPSEAALASLPLADTRAPLAARLKLILDLWDLVPPADRESAS